MQEGLKYKLFKNIDAEVMREELLKWGLSYASRKPQTWWTRENGQYVEHYNWPEIEEWHKNVLSFYYGIKPTIVWSEKEQKDVDINKYKMFVTHGNTSTPRRYITTPTTLMIKHSYKSEEGESDNRVFRAITSWLKSIGKEAVISKNDILLKGNKIVGGVQIKFNDRETAEWVGLQIKPQDRLFKELLPAGEYEREFDGRKPGSVYNSLAIINIEKIAASIASFL